MKHLNRTSRATDGLTNMLGLSLTQQEDIWRPLDMPFVKLKDTQRAGAEDYRYHSELNISPNLKQRFLRLVNQFYRRQTLGLVYEDLNRHVSLSTTRVRQRLCDLMGTDVIRLNDKRYFQRLSQRLQEEYDGAMDKQEDERAAQEDERLRRLMLEGVIETADDYRAVVHGEHKEQKSKKTKKRKNKRRIRITESQAGHDMERSHSAMSRNAEEDDVDGNTSKENIKTQIELMTDKQGTKDSLDAREHRETRATPVSILKKKEDKENDNSAQKINVRPPHHDNVGRSPSSSSYRKSRRVKSAAPRLTRERENQSDDSGDDMDDRKFDTQSLPDRDNHGRYSKYSKQEPESIRRLRKEQTVAGLYSIAEELVSPLRADDVPDRKGKKPY